MSYLYLDGALFSVTDPAKYYRRPELTEENYERERDLRQLTEIPSDPRGLVRDSDHRRSDRADDLQREPSR